MLKLYNTLTRKKEVLNPLASARGEKLKLFVCGITPYDYPHIGNARTYIAFDAFVRFLRSQGYEVNYLQNVTDVDDKIIARAGKDKKTWKETARFFERVYLQNMKVLGITSVSRYARATEHIPEIINQIQRLEKKGYAYKVPGEGLYFDISKFTEYGKLSRRTQLQAEDAVSRIDESLQKRNKGDFALWKFSKPGEPKWQSPWGQGRPGWHIEDTAITEKYFGPQYDLHGGARDLIFPHHEAEIAQMEAVSEKKPMARYWMHTGFLTVEGKKMSKSLGNFVTVQDFLKKHSTRVLRLLVLKAHYRSPIDYSDKLLLQTERELERIDEFVERLKSRPRALNQVKELHNLVKDAKQAFHKALEDDFNTPKAISVLFELVSKGNTLMAKNALATRDAKATFTFLKEADTVFGFILSGKKATISAFVAELVRERENYRKAGEWQKADSARKKLLAAGWQVDDTPQGPRLKKAS